MELLGKVVIGIDPAGPYARDALVTLGRAGAAVAVASSDGGQTADDIANRIRKRGGKASVKRLAKEGWGAKLIRDVVGEFGRADAIILFACAPPASAGPAGWGEFLAMEAGRPAELLAGLKQLRYPADGRIVGITGLLTAPAPGPATRAWEGLWRGMASAFAPEATQVRGALTGISVTGTVPSPGETVLAEGVNRLLTLLVADEGMPARGQVVVMSLPAPVEGHAEGTEASPENRPEPTRERGKSRPAGSRGTAYRPPRGTKQTR